MEYWVEMTDFSGKTDAQIDAWIKNHETKRATTHPLYFELLEERVKRGQGRTNLSTDRSLNLLRNAAKEQRCVTYGDLAKESGVAWSQARHKMNGLHGHLDQLLDSCHFLGLPMLPALCVNKNGLEHGELEENALSGFANGARRLGHVVTDERAFHHLCRDACWEWGRRNFGLGAE